MTEKEQIEVLETLATHYKTKSIELEQNLIVAQCEAKRYFAQLQELQNVQSAQIQQMEIMTNEVENVESSIV